MAVHTRGNDNNEEIRAAEQRQPEQPQTAPTQTRAANGLRSINRVLSRNISRNTGSEQVLTMKKLMEDVIEEKGLPKEYFHLVSIDTTVYNVAYPTLAVVLEEEVNGKAVYNAFIFAMCGGMAELPKREMQLPGETIYVPRTWVDNITQHYRGEVRAALNTFIGLDKIPNGGNVTIVGATVVPHEIKRENAHIALTCLAAAENACATRFAMDYGRVLGIPAFDIGWLSDRDQPVSNVQFNRSAVQDTDIVGNPVRSDISVTLSNRIRNQNNDYDQQQRLIAATGFIDLTYAQQEFQPMSQWQQPVLPKTVCYQPRFVFTSMYPLDIEAFTPELLAMGFLSTVATLNTGNTWMHNFIAAARQKGGLHNPGALAMELSVDQKDAIDLSNQTDEEIYAFMQTVVYPELVYSIDIPEDGEYSWLLGLLAKAATVQGSPAAYKGDNKAYETLYNAFDVATLGYFSKVFGKGESMLTSAENRIALGYYIGADNMKHDIRDVDTLYMLNQSGNNLDAVIAWADTFDQTNIDVNRRVVTRDQILTNHFASAWQQTGWAQRYDISSRFLTALVEAAVKAGFNIRPENIRAFTGATTRGNSNIRQFAMGEVDNNIYARSGNGNNDTNQRGVPAAFNMFD